MKKLLLILGIILLSSCKPTPVCVEIFITQVRIPTDSTGKDSVMVPVAPVSMTAQCVKRTDSLIKLQ